MYGIDVSSYQQDLDVSTLNVDFVIFKATEGLGYVDSTFNKFSTDCEKSGKLFGFYHFARENDPKEEARFFYETCKNLIGYGLPVLDYETTNENDMEWCESFAWEFHELSGIFPVLYISANMCGTFTGSWLADYVPIWVAGYPYAKAYYSFDATPEFPYSIAPWDSCIIWQFTSNMYLDEYASRLDADVAYISREQWLDLVNGEDTMTDEQIEKIAAACASYVWQGSAYDKENNLNMYNCAHWTYEYVLKLYAEVTAMQETVKILAEGKGADPEQIMKAVTDAVTKRLKELKIEIR